MRFKEAQKRAIELFESPEFINERREEDPKMLKFLNLLQEMNRLGFLTENSQAGNFTRGKHYKDNLPYQIHERAYVSGFMLEKDAIDFIKEFNLLNNKNAAFIPICDDNIYIPSSLDIPVTYSIHKNEKTISTHFSMALPKTVFESYKKQLKLNKSEKVVYIFCWDTRWDYLASKNDGLFKDIIKVLNKI